MVKIHINIEPLHKALRGIERQAKFGTAQAMSEVVDLIMYRSIGRLSLYFKTRSQWHTRGFRTQHARRDKLEAWVGHLDKMLQLQAEGGKKAVGPKAGKFGQGIPQKGADPAGDIKMPRGSGGERPTYRGMGNWPGQLMRAVDQFNKRASKAWAKKSGSASQTRALAGMAKSRAGSNRLVFMEHAKVPTIAIRVAAGSGKGKFVPLWFLKNAPVNIPKRWKFYEDGESFLATNMPPLMERHINKALGMIGKP